MEIDPGDKPREGKFADKAGAYNLVVQSDRPFAHKGKVTTLRLFISGYGEILSAKLFIVMPPEFHDKDKSYVRHDINKLPNGKFGFGTSSTELTEQTVHSIGGLQIGKWREPTIMFDMNKPGSGTPMILSETSQEKAPFEIEVMVRRFSFSRYIRPGRHTAQFILTYFNGSQWISTKTTYDFILPNLYERYTLHTWAIGTILTIIGIIVAFKQNA